MPTTNQLCEQLEGAQSISEHVGTLHPDDTYEDGVIAALSWVLNQAGQPIGTECFDLSKEAAND